jgi:F420H(2)-dependent quinone reductase
MTTSAGPQPLGEIPGIHRLARMINRLTAPGSGPALFLRAHRWIYENSGGRIGHGMIGAPALLLYTTGRRSGQRRCAALVYGRDGETVVVAASNDGLDHSPAWLHNLRAHPAVEMQLARRRPAGHAAIIDATHTEYRRLWEVMNDTNHHRYDVYQAKTSRRIPLVLIIPVGGVHGISEHQDH